MIEVIVADLGGVVARFCPKRRLQELSALSGVPEARIEESLFSSGFERRAETGEYRFDEVVDAVREALDGRVDEAAIIEAWAKAFEIDAEVLEYLAALPLRRALFTNNGPMLDACLAGALRSLTETFGEVVCSWQIRARKPDAVAFERAAERLGCRPHGLLLLDDSAENVAAAIGAGWDAECVTGLDAVRAAIERRPELRNGPSGG